MATKETAEEDPREAKCRGSARVCGRRVNLRIGGKVGRAAVVVRVVLTVPVRTMVSDGEQIIEEQARVPLIRMEQVLRK